MSVAFHPPPQRILVRGVNWLGDAVMTTPAVLRLREKFPDAQITLLTPEKLKDMWQQHPAVDKVIGFAADETVFAVAKRLRGEKFDLALVLPNSPRSALETYLARIPQRIGLARPWRNFFLTQAVAPRTGEVKMRKRSVEEIQKLVATQEDSNLKFKVSNAAHQVHEYLHLVAALGASSEPLVPQLVVRPEEVEAAKKKFGLEKISQPIFGLNPGAEYGPAKRWPVEKFIAAARDIQKQTDCIWVLFGGKGDAELTARIASELQHQSTGLTHNLAGKTSLRELMAVLKCCRVVLTNDTGPMHVAAALEVPVVVPFGSTSPELTGPIFSATATILKSAAPCSPCFLRECPIDFRCMNGISVERVVHAVIAAAKISVG